MITAFFIEIILTEDDGKNKKEVSFKLPVAAISGLLAIGSVYYIIQYQKYRDFSYFSLSEEISAEEKMLAYSHLPPVFGFSEEKELILFMLLPISEDNLQERIALGDRVSYKNFNVDLLIKQGSLLAVAILSGQTTTFGRPAC